MVNFLIGIKSLGVCGIASFATAAVHMPTALPLADRIAFRPPVTRGSGDGDFVPGPRGGGGGGGARAESAGRAAEPGARAPPPARVRGDDVHGDAAGLRVLRGGARHDALPRQGRHAVYERTWC